MSTYLEFYLTRGLAGRASMWVIVPSRTLPHWSPILEQVFMSCFQHVMQFLIRRAESFCGARNTTFISFKRVLY